MFRVAAQTRLAATTTAPPASKSGRMGKWSASIPKGRLASAIPSTTAETVRDAIAALTMNSSRRIGSTGWVM